MCASDAPMMPVHLHNCIYIAQDDISLDYDPVRNEDYWKRRPVAVVQRGMQIAGAFGAWFLRGRVQAARTAVPDAVALRQAEQLRHILTRLGPAFVKIGQVSTGYMAQCRLQRMQLMHWRLHNAT